MASDPIQTTKVNLWVGGTIDVPSDHPMFKSKEELKALIKTTTSITFQGMLLFDALMRENNCKRICAYEGDCACWREWLVAVKELDYAI